MITKIRLPLVHFAPTSDIKAKIPPSPRLSARITYAQYLSEMVISNAQMIRDKTPSALCGESFLPMIAMTVCKV